MSDSRHGSATVRAADARETLAHDVPQADRRDAPHAREVLDLPEWQILVTNAAFGYGAEIGRQGIRVISVCPSEVQTTWGGRVGRNNPNKLYAEDIAETVMATLSMHPRALWHALAVFATNPWKED